MLPSDFTLAHGLAVALLFGSWFAYSAVLARLGRGSLNAQLAVVRRIWIDAATRRQAKPFDAVLLGHIVNSVAFFGSATLIVLAGVITGFASVNEIHATTRTLHFVADASLELFALELTLVVLVLAIAFFSFTYALRKLIYTLALVGALPDAADGVKTHDELVRHATDVLTEAITTFNFGIRGYYYAVAAICLFVSPYACMAATVIATGTLFYRQLGTKTSRAIQAYVEAARAIDPR